MATYVSDQEHLLKLLAERGTLDSYELSQELAKDHQAIVGTIKSLHSLGEVSTGIGKVIQSIESSESDN